MFEFGGRNFNISAIQNYGLNKLDLQIFAKFSHTTKWILLIKLISISKNLTLYILIDRIIEFFLTYYLFITKQSKTSGKKYQRKLDLSYLRMSEKNRFLIFFIKI